MTTYFEAESVERDLGIPLKTLYALSNSISRQYHRRELPKHGGGVRVLSVPSYPLKQAQRRITECILVHAPVSPYATAYRYGASVQKNAAPHVGKKQILKLDILHFFDSIRYIDVKDTVFPAERFGEQVRILLAMLCYHRDGLPQGAPSSPAITNILMREFDDTVGAWCATRGITYTRYCDDMTFSGDFDAEEAKHFVEDALKKRGFLLNAKKTALIPATKRQTVTGIVVNDKLSVPAESRRAIRKEVYYCKKYGVAAHVEHIGSTLSAERYLQGLLGRIAFALETAPTDKALLSAKQFVISELKKLR